MLVDMNMQSKLITVKDVIYLLLLLDCTLCKNLVYTSQYRNRYLWRM